MYLQMNVTFDMDLYFDDYLYHNLYIKKYLYLKVLHQVYDKIYHQQFRHMLHWWEMKTNEYPAKTQQFFFGFFYIIKEKLTNRIISMTISIDLSGKIS